MTKKIQCQTKIKKEVEPVRVRIIKSPLVDSGDLRQIVLARSRAVVLINN